MIVIFLLFAVSAWCAQPTISDSANFLDNDVEGSQTLKISFPRQDVITLPRVVQNTHDDRIAVRPYQVRSDCLPKCLRYLRCKTEMGKDTVALYGDGHQELQISLPHEGINISQTSGCLLEAVTANSQGNRLRSHILWCRKSQCAGDLLLHTPKAGVFMREFPWLFGGSYHNCSEYNFELESLSITRVVRKYNDGSSVFVRAKVAYANLQEVTFSLGLGLVPCESLLLSEVVKL